MYGQDSPAAPHVAPSNSLGGGAAPNSFTGMSADTAARVDRIQALLSKKLGPEFLSTRQGGGGTKLTYIEGWRVINLANEIFGYNGWFTEIKQIEVDFVDFDPETRRYCMGVSAIVRVRLQDGASHEDIGYGKLENTKSKGDGLDKCKKEAVTDALKRTLRNFGSLLGNCLYDKQYTAEVGKMKAQKQKMDFNEMHRPDFVAASRSNATASTSALPAPPPAAAESKPAPATTAKPVPQRPPAPQQQQQTKPRVQPPLQRAATTGAVQNQNRPPAPVRQPLAHQQQQHHQPNPQIRSETADMFGAEDDGVFAGVDLDAAMYNEAEESIQGLVFEGDSGFAEGGLEYESPKPDPPPAHNPALRGPPAQRPSPVTRTPQEQEQAKQQAQERRRLLQQQQQQQQQAGVRQAAGQQAQGRPVAMTAAQMVAGGPPHNELGVPKPGLRPARPPPGRAASVPAQHQTPQAGSRPIPRPQAVQAGHVPPLNVGGAEGRLGGGGTVSEVLEATGIAPLSGQTSFTSARALKRSADVYEPTPPTQPGQGVDNGQHRSPLREIEGSKRFKEN